MATAHIVPMGRVRAPLQRRSRRVFERVLVVFVAMLADKPFEQITMAELARRARVAVTSIYARFEDKRALVLAAHERMRDDVMRELAEILAPQRWRGAALETIAHALIERSISHRRRHNPLLRAALLVNDREIYERSAQMNRYASELLAQLLAPHLTWLAEAERPRAVDFAWRAVTAVMQQ